MKQQNSTQDEQTVEIPIIPPRDPSSYRVTKHFVQRLRERDPANYRDFLPAQLIRNGRVRRIDDRGVADHIPDGDHGACIAFTTVGPADRPWTLIAALRPEGFAEEDEYHRVITIWQGTPNQNRVAS